MVEYLILTDDGRIAHADDLDYSDLSDCADGKIEIIRLDDCRVYVDGQWDEVANWR